MPLASLIPLLMALSLPATESTEGSSPRDMDSFYKACDMAAAAVLASGEYSTDQIAGCDWADPSDEFPDYTIVRLNGECQDDICGSVLLGWYGVRLDTGAVYQWDVAEWAAGPELLPKSE